MQDRFTPTINQNKIYHLDAILLTHEHYDHVGGLDDVRPLGGVKVYGRSNVLRHSKKYALLFCKNKLPGVPNLKLIEIDESEFEIEGIKITPIRVMHAKLPILGYRIGDIAYITDAKTISDSDRKNERVKNSCAECTSKRISFSHLSLDEALKIATKVNADTTYFTCRA